MSAIPAGKIASNVPLANGTSTYRALIGRDPDLQY
jgi:hypothetical protein